MSDDGVKLRRIGHVATMGPVANARVQDAAAWSLAVTREVRSLIATLGAQGLGIFDIAAAIGCSPRSLYSWRRGGAEMPASKLLALRDLAARGIRRAG